MKSSAVPIGDVARRFGVETHVLRHWENEGLLAPRRDAGGRRRYSPSDLFRVAAILRAKQVGLPLEQIRTMIATEEPRARRDMLGVHRDTLRERIGKLQRRVDLLDRALECDHADITTCPRFREQLTGNPSLAVGDDEANHIP